MAKDNTLKILSHVLGLANIFFFLMGVLGPLIIYFVAENARDKEHAKKALNWQISYIIYFIIMGIAMVFLIIIVIIAPFLGMLSFIWVLVFFGLYIMNLVFCIMAAVKASRDELWDYPLAIPFLK